MRVTDEMVFRALAHFYPCEEWPPSDEPDPGDLNEIAFRRDRMDVMRGTLETALSASPAAALADALRPFAKATARIPSAMTDNDSGINVRVGDLRAAAKALAACDAAQGGGVER